MLGLGHIESLIRTLQRGKQPTKLARALQELRPAVWIVAISEWAALGAVLVWVSVVAWQRACLEWPDFPR